MNKRKRAWPWIEGGVLAAVVLFVLVIGGESVRASYHGYLHTSIGQAVLRDGLIPENPYHAGETLRYYTLYPTLGPLLGQLGGGPIWFFAFLNGIAALLFGPAWDSFARAAGLRFKQRRASFLAAVFGFNALGWIGWFLWPPDPQLAVPIFAFESMTIGSQASEWMQNFGWDARLQSFLPKFLNVSSFALALPFMLWAMAPALSQDGRAMRIIAPLAIVLAINPLAGGFAVLCIALWQWPSLLRPSFQQKLTWPVAGVIAGLLALPFLLPLFQSAPTGESLTGEVRFQHDGFMNFIGPMLLLLYPGFRGCNGWKSGERTKWLYALILAILVMAFARLPWGNQYKLARIAGLLWAIPVGRWAIHLWTDKTWQRWLPIACLMLAIPSFVLVIHSYQRWGSQAPPSNLVSDAGQLEIRSELLSKSFPFSLQEAESGAPNDAVIWMHRNHPGTRATNGVVQGNALAPILHHSLFVDNPQIHNNGLSDLKQRLHLSEQFWGSNASGGQGNAASGQEQANDSAAALSQARSILPDRSLLVVSHSSFPWTLTALREAGGTELAAETGFSLWQLPALNSVDEN